MCLFYLDHLSYIALRACVFSRVFNFHQHDKEQVVPHVVLLLYVFLKSHGLIVKFVPLQACRVTKRNSIYTLRIYSIFRIKSVGFGGFCFRTDFHIDR